jgi:uncharacterized protein YwbE
MTDPSSNIAPISWRAVTYGTPVLTVDGETLGTVREILGSDAEDVFHGVRVALNDGSADVVLSSDQVAGLTIAAVSTSLTSDQLIALPSYADEATYHLASVGWLRKHVGWTRDSHKDEEPG